MKDMEFSENLLFQKFITYLVWSNPFQNGELSSTYVGTHQSQMGLIGIFWSPEYHFCHVIFPFKVSSVGCGSCLIFLKDLWWTIIAFEGSSCVKEKFMHHKFFCLEENSSRKCCWKVNQKKCSRKCSF